MKLPPPPPAFVHTIPMWFHFLYFCIFVDLTGTRVKKQGALIVLVDSTVPTSIWPRPRWTVMPVTTVQAVLPRQTQLVKLMATNVPLVTRPFAEILSFGWNKNFEGFVPFCSWYSDVLIEFIITFRSLLPSRFVTTTSVPGGYLRERDTNIGSKL